MSAMDTMLQQLTHKEHYEEENSSFDKCCLQELTNMNSDYYKSTQDGYFTHQSTEEIFMESHCNELELELAALTMLFKSLGNGVAFDSKGVRLFGDEHGCDSFDSVTNLDKDDCVLLEELIGRRVDILSKQTHVESSPESKLDSSKTLRELDEILFQDRLSNKKPRTK
jgi:hypothetical protein